MSHFELHDQAAMKFMPFRLLSCAIGVEFQVRLRSVDAGEEPCESGHGVEVEDSLELCLVFVARALEVAGSSSGRTDGAAGQD